MNLPKHVLCQSFWLTGPALALLVGLLAIASYSTAGTTEPPADAEKPAVTDSDTAGNDDEEDDDDEMMLDPLGPNAACYVCHMTFVFEELARTHLGEKVTCIDCHGLSAAHANDEDIGATKPDITYKRDKIDASCEKCHEDHDVPAQQVVARYLERKLKNPKPVCTDCHGTHRIEEADEESEIEGPADPEPKPKPAPPESKS